MFTFSRRVHIYETDSMGIVHHSNYWRFFEEARIEVLIELGLAKPGELRDAWAVYHGEIKYLRPLKGMQKFEVVTRLRSEKAKIIFEYKVFDEGQKNLCTLARTDLVLVNDDMKIKRVPENYLQKIGESPWTETWL